MKIALVKQDVYQDLYIGDNSMSSTELLFSSIMRVGPIGLIHDLEADFYIIQEDIEFEECRFWESQLPISAEVLRRLKNESPVSVLGEERNLSNTSTISHGDYSRKHSDIDWSKYDVVFSINISVPRKVIERFSNTLWCYMPGEGRSFIDFPNYGYDAVLNQLTRGYSEAKNGVIDFPYTFLSSNTIYDIISKHLGREPLNKGIYVEINSCLDRPVKKVPDQFKSLGELHTIRLHKPDIRDNLIEVYDSKYFLKLGGRMIRGNSVFEAISAGTLVLMLPNELIHNQVIPKECWVQDQQEAQEKIKFLDSNPLEYDRLLNLQRNLLQHFAFDLPLYSINAMLYKKRELGSFDTNQSVSKADRSIKSRVKRLLGMI